MYVQATGMCGVTISGMTGYSQELRVLEAEVSLTGKDWQKHPIVTGPDAHVFWALTILRTDTSKTQEDIDGLLELLLWRQKELSS